MNRLTIYAAAVLYTSEHASLPPLAAYTAVVDTGRRTFTFGAQHADPDATAAALAGLVEAVSFLKSPAQIRLVNDNVAVGSGCLDRGRRNPAYDAEWRLLDGALVAGGHRIIGSQTALGDEVIRRARETADEIARWPDRARRLLQALRESLNAERAVGGEGPPAPRPEGAEPAGDLVTPKQLGFIRSLARQCGVDPEEECLKVAGIPLEQLPKGRASGFIDDLKRRLPGPPA